MGRSKDAYSWSITKTELYTQRTIMKKKNKTRQLWASLPLAFIIVATVAFVSYALYGVLENLVADIYVFYAQYTPRSHWGVSMFFVPVYVAIYYWAKHKATKHHFIPLHIAVVMTLSYAAALLFGFDALVKAGVISHLFPLSFMLGGVNYTLPQMNHWIAGGIAGAIVLSLPVAFMVHHLSRRRTVIGKSPRREI